MQNQTLIAKRVVNILEESKQFDSVLLSGSVAKREHDELSDIDILISSNQRSPKENVELASQLICSELGIILSGWSVSTLPNKCLINHFLPDIPLFWWIDLGCMANEKYDLIYRNDIIQNQNEHIAKLWTMNAKHFLRKTKSRLKIQELYVKAFGSSNEFPGEIAAFQEILETIDFGQLNEQFETGCTQIMDRIERVY